MRLADLPDLDSAEPALQALGEGMAPSPCPFMRDGICSVYDVLPMDCRLLWNLDDDDLLCRLVPGQMIPVPYANSQHLKGVYLLAQMTTPVADIRNVFPTGA